MLELLQNLTLPQILMIVAGGYLIYTFFLKKSPVTILPTSTPVLTVAPLTSSETTRKINNALNPLEPQALLKFEQKKVVGLVAEWADLRDAAVANGAVEAVKKLDDLFPLLNKPEAEAPVVKTHVTI